MSLPFECSTWKCFGSVSTVQPHASGIQVYSLKPIVMAIMALGLLMAAVSPASVRAQAAFDSTRNPQTAERNKTTPVVAPKSQGSASAPASPRPAPLMPPAASTPNAPVLAAATGSAPAPKTPATAATTPAASEPASASVAGTVSTRSSSTVAATGAAQPLLAQAGAVPAAAAAPALREVDLDLRDFIRQIRAVNKAIVSKRTEREVTQTSIDRARAAFQTQANASVVRGRQLVENTPEEQFARRNEKVYDRLGTDYSVGVSQLFATGTKLEAKTTLSQFFSNINNVARQGTPEDGATDYKTYYGLSVTHPLARDAGRDITLARVRVAELETRAAEFASGDTEASVVAEAVFAYWELALAQERLTSSQEKVRMGERLLQEAIALNRQGRLPQSEIWEVENNLGRYQSGLSEARQGLQERVGRLRTLLMATATEGSTRLRAADRMPTVRDQTVSFDQAMRKALERRDDYRMRKTMLEREGVQLAYANNQGLPKIDLVASYGLNNWELGSASKAYALSRMEDYPTWTVGVQLSMPLGENQQAKADIVAAKLRREDALLQLKAIEVSIANDIDTAISMVASAAERVKLWQDVAAREQRQLELERSRFTAGRSDMREILLREERAINARLAVVEQQAAWSKADILLEAAQGQLLDRFR
jgi:outer membrane protein TolC